MPPPLLQSLNFLDFAILEAAAQAATRQPPPRYPLMSNQELRDEVHALLRDTYPPTTLRAITTPVVAAHAEALRDLAVQVHPAFPAGWVLRAPADAVTTQPGGFINRAVPLRRWQLQFVADANNP